MKAPRFLDNFDAILLDMGRTFMFEVDRFDDPDSFAKVYNEIGGRALGPERLAAIITGLHERAVATYRDPAFIERYPSLRDHLLAMPEIAGLAEAELGRLLEVFARHEIGVIPEDYIATLRRLRQSHRLGLVSNIWSPSDLFLSLFHRLQIRELFTVIVFSSDLGALKPSTRLFETALAAFPCPRARVLMVGDRLSRDVAGAKAVGIAAVWISPDGVVPAGAPAPDLIIRDLRELPER